MTEEENARIVRETTETVVNEHNPNAIDEYFTEDATIEGAGSTLSREEFKEFTRGVFHAFPDVTFTYDELFAKGDMVAFRWIVEGTHEGEFQGIEATGNEFSYPAVGIAKIEDGKIAELKYESDRVSLMEQLGATP
ncbi:MAG: ester cyclase [Halobacteria archaeon]|nr:ester cyclase [Halobacteria archaeon]